ncbi:MAG: two-component system sensor histidine kinase NtrB [Desulfopila sp.]
MSGLSLLPTVFVEFIGSALVIVLAFIALRYAWALTRLKPANFIWGFLWYFSIALAAFAISRGVGHIVRIILVWRDQHAIWDRLAPFSGGFNTMLLIAVAAVTFYYHKGLAAYKAIRSEAEKLAEANSKLAASARQLQRLNTDLEGIVEDRTRDLSESERIFRNFFENSKDIVYFCDLLGNITKINSSGMEMLGVEADTPLNFHQLFRDPAVLTQYLEEIRTRGYVSDLDMECLGKDGSIRHILLAANASLGPDGRMVGYEGIGKDMTRLHTITEQLINHEKMASVGEMAAGVAHEINTPLGIILGYTQLMMDDFSADSESYVTLQVIERQTKVCRRIVSDLLKFSRQAESQKTAIDLNEIVREVLAVTEHTLNINKITVSRRFAENLPRVIGDPEKLHQVFINLFNNAQYAMASGGTITIITFGAAEAVKVSVIDTGSGIDESIKNKIFDPFFTTKEVGKGTGLGLSVTYGIIQEHKGQIEVESPVTDAEEDAGHRGCAFHITLPIAHDDDEEAGKELKADG